MGPQQKYFRKKQLKAKPWLSGIWLEELGSALDFSLRSSAGAHRFVFFPCLLWSPADLRSVRRMTSNDLSRLHESCCSVQRGGFVGFDLC